MSKRLTTLHLLTSTIEIRKALHAEHAAETLEGVHTAKQIIDQGGDYIFALKLLI